MGVKPSAGALEATDLRAKVMRIARGLLAKRGLRNVTVREIALAAGQRNMGVVGYYFGTGEPDRRNPDRGRAEGIEARRRTYLERMELGDGPRSVLEVIEAMVRPSVEYAEEATENTFNRFLMQVSLSDEGFIDRTLGGRWNSGYERCLRLLRGFIGGGFDGGTKSPLRVPGHLSRRAAGLARKHDRRPDAGPRDVAGGRDAGRHPDHRRRPDRRPGRAPLSAPQRA